MRILMAGASGYLGGHLAERLHAAGHDITRLVRRPARGPGEITWEPAEGRLDPAAVAAADVVVNLSGANVGDHRWTSAYKAILLSSRVGPSGTISRTIARLPAADRPRVLLQASGVGFYGDTGDREAAEDAPSGATFPAEMCRAWESAAHPAEEAGTRVVLLRTAPLISADGAVVKMLLLPFRLGLGARVGGGRQWMAWMGLADWLGAVDLILGRDDIAGPVNMVGAEQATNADFTRAFGRAVHRPAVLAVPGAAVSVAVGGLASELRISQRVVPGVLRKAGFRWQQPTIQAALTAAVS